MHEPFRTLTLLALGAAMSTLVDSQLVAAPELAAPARFVPPANPLIVTRTVWRELGDGSQIVVRRSYLIAFTTSGEGFVVTGTQIGCEVQAPPAVAAIAKLERERIDTGAFPLRLSAEGMIRLGSAPAGGPLHQQGREAAGALLAGAALADKDQREGEAFLASVAGSGAIPWPVDLFNPREAQRTDQRDVTLPDGTLGRLTIRFAADQRGANGLPGKFSREVASELGGTRRVSREEWSFAERSGP